MKSLPALRHLRVDDLFGNRLNIIADPSLKRATIEAVIYIVATQTLPQDDPEPIPDAR